MVATCSYAFEGTVKQVYKNYNGTGADVTMTWYIKGNNCRIDMTTSAKEAKGTTVLLIDATSQKLKMYNDDASAPTRVYYDVSLADIASSSADVSIAKTTDTKTIQGYKCEKYQATNAHGAYDIWFTKDIAVDWSAIKDFFKESTEIQTLAKEGIKGFPLLTEAKDKGATMSVSAITVQALSSTTFTVPADYKLFTNTAAKK